MEKPADAAQIYNQTDERSLYVAEED